MGTPGLGTADIGTSGMESLSAIGARVRSFRKRRGLTQEELAGRIGRSAEALSVLERGRSTPTLPVLERLAKELEVPLRDFFAPAAAPAQSPEEAAAFTALLDSLRGLPLAALELTARLVAAVAEFHARIDPGRQDLGGAGEGAADFESRGPQGADLPRRPAGSDVGRDGPAPGGSPGGSLRELCAALLRLYGNDRQALTATLTRRKRFLLELGEEEDAAVLERLLKLVWQR